MIVDFHNHYFAPGYVAAIKAGPSSFRITIDDSDNPVLHSPGDYNVLVPDHRDIDYRVGVLDDAGIDMQVISFTAPGTSIESPQRAAELATVVNDGLAEAVAAHPDRFAALGHLPLNNPAAATAELDRVLGELQLPGVMLYSNANGVALADERFWPLYERANEAGAVV